MSTPLHIRAAQLLRLLLSSNQVGEVAGATAALSRVITASGHDVHWLANLVENALQQPSSETSDGNEWTEVDSYTLSYHRKPGSKPGLCVSYRCGSATYHDFWAIQHDGLAREIAGEKWADLGGEMPVPGTVNEAIERQGELCAEVEIAIRYDGRYWQLVGQRVREGEPAA
jgi:hypothetical protein